MKLHYLALTVAVYSTTVAAAGDASSKHPVKRQLSQQAEELSILLVPCG